MAELKTYVVDIDNTICTQVYGDYSFAEPFPNRINKINELYDSGNTIIYFTARGMGRGKNSVRIAYDACYQQTYEQLLSWGCRFSTLMLGKPFGDVYIDDKAISDKDFFINDSNL
jgi:hypothetical protein